MIIAYCGGKMGLKSRIFEFIVRHNLLPIGIRWRKCASGVGRLYNDVFHLLAEDERYKLSRLMHDWGVSDADEVVEALGIKRDLHGCATALMVMNCIFGIKSYIAKECADEIVIHATECLWKDKKNWTPAVCASIEQYDVGLVKGINKDVDYYCTKRRSKGDNVCEVILRKETHVTTSPQYSIPEHYH
ncbi:MAG: hypothetical protein QW222_07265 [Candidatus Bathyarchaeia archaeon]